jgi:hypothetical protein
MDLPCRDSQKRVKGEGRMRKEYNIDLHLRIPIPLDQKIDTYCNTLRKRTKTDGIRELIEIGLFTFENWSKIRRDPHTLEVLHKQLKEGELVDYIQNMEHRDFEIMFEIFKTEHKARYGSKSNAFISSINSMSED